MKRRVVVTMTGLGLIADLAYFQICIALMLFGDGQWIPAAVWYLSGAGAVVWLTTVGWRLARTVLAQAREVGR